MPTDLQLEFTDAPRADDLEFVDAGLHQFNVNAVDLSAVQSRTCFARDAGGRVVGGVRARQWGTAVEVQQLWVDEAWRRQGVATRLMRRLEDEVRCRGARLIYLDTFSFQAPQFYRRCGFETALRIDGFPDGISRHLMVKQVSGGEAG